MEYECLLKIDDNQDVCFYFSHLDLGQQVSNPS